MSRCENCKAFLISEGNLCQDCAGKIIAYLRDEKSELLKQMAEQAKTQTTLLELTSRQRDEIITQNNSLRDENNSLKEVLNVYKKVKNQDIDYLNSFLERCLQLIKDDAEAFENAESNFYSSSLGKKHLNLWAQFEESRTLLGYEDN